VQLAVMAMCPMSVSDPISSYNIIGIMGKLVFLGFQLPNEQYLDRLYLFEGDKVSSV